jgi:hypothetical protein
MKCIISRNQYLGACVAALCFLMPEFCAGSDVTASQISAVSSGTPAVSSEIASTPEDSRSKAQESVNALSLEIQELKQSVITLNKNLRVLEEDLLFPANTQVTVFLSLDIGKYFTLDSVKLKLDGKVVASHNYSDRERVALARGGVHRLHVANLSVGEHNISAFFTGMGPSGREYKRGTSLKISKESGPKYVELKISDSTMKLQPEFTVAQW